MEPIFKPGEKVKVVLPTLEKETPLDQEIGISSYMRDLQKRVVTIRKRVDKRYVLNEYAYFIEEAPGWIWSPRWFRPIRTIKYKDLIKCKDGV